MSSGVALDEQRVVWLGHAKVGVFHQNLHRGFATSIQARDREKQGLSSSLSFDISDDIMSAFDVSDLEPLSAPKDLSEVYMKFEVLNCISLLNDDN